MITFNAGKNALLLTHYEKIRPKHFFLNYLDQYKSSIGSFLGLEAPEISLFWKGRVGLFAILKSLGIGAGDEIILPAFTCVVVPNAIIYLGAKPIYIDIDPNTYNIDCTKVEAKITTHTKLIIAQNTFGLSSDIDALKNIAEKHQLFLIEDCTHGFGGTYKGQSNGTLTAAAFFSSQWNKPFSTGIGGFVVSKDLELANQLSTFEKTLIQPSRKEEQMLRAQITVRKKYLGPSLYWQAIKLYRFLSKHNLITGSSQGTELASPQMPDGYLKGLSNTQAKEGINEINNFEKNLVHRQKIASIYTEGLKRIGVKTPFVPTYASHTFVMYPLLVKDRTSFFVLAEKNKIRLSDWFLSPIHPIVENFELWQYNYGQCPIAEKISKHIINLPTDQSITHNEAKRIVEFLKENENMLVKNEDDY